MKKELEYFYVDGDYGFNQESFGDALMRAGGCAAVTACDLFIYLKKYFGLKIYPYSAENVTKSDYIAFSKEIKPFLHPRLRGIDRTDIYTDGVNAYLKKIGGGSLVFDSLDGNAPVQEAEIRIKERIEDGMPVPILILRHKNPEYSDFVWHWFLLTGFSENGNGFLVKAVSYGKYEWLDFSALWDTGCGRKGGLVLPEIRPDSA